MIRAESKATTSRRGFLARGAAAVAGGALLASPAIANPGADPIFDAIEKHKVARATWIKWVDTHGDLENELPREKRRSRVDAWEEKIVESDDPRWPECERAVIKTSGAETEAACDLLNVSATTVAGLIALLRYANEADTDGIGWPDQLGSGDEDKTRSWHYFLVLNLIETISELNAMGMV
jgi:hypothetical protein